MLENDDDQKGCGLSFISSSQASVNED